MNEDPLIGRCLEGDGEAFEMLVNRFQSGVLSLAWSILGNREEAEDAVQEAFVRAFTNLPAFDRSRSFRPWLYSIAAHGCLDRLKRRRVERLFRHDPSFLPAGSGTSVAPERRVDDAELLAPLLRRLKSKERSALYLAAVEGYTSAEVGAVLGCSEGSARVRIHAAKKKIRAWIERNPDVRRNA